MTNAKKPRTPKITYNEFLIKVKDYLEKHNKNGVEFVLKYSKWLDIYYTNHDKAYEDIIKDTRFKLEAGLVTEQEIEEKNKEIAKRRKKKTEGEE